MAKNILLHRSQGVLLNVLVYYNIIKDIFGSDVGDTNLASLLQVSDLFKSRMDLPISYFYK